MDVPEAIACVECGGVAHLMSNPPPDEGFSPGDNATFVCSDCGNRHDVIVVEDEDDGDEYGGRQVL